MAASGPHKPKHPGWLFLGLGAFVLLFLALFHTAEFKEVVAEANRWAIKTMNAHPVSGAAVFFLFSALSAMLAFASTAVLVPPAILAWGKLLTFLLLWSGWIAGAMTAYFIGRLARPLLDRLGYEKHLEQYERFVSKQMSFWTVFGFCLAVPSEVPGYLFGNMRYPFAKFIGAIALVEGLYAVGTLIAGKSLLSAEFAPAMGAFGVLILMIVGASLWFRSYKRKASKSSRVR